VSGDPNKIRLGHALRVADNEWNGNDPDITNISKEAYAYATDKRKLIARPPAPKFKDAVFHAEEQIGINPHDSDDKKPIYAYLGDLHAHLGQVGLVFERAWARRCLHGFTRCDSGGMVGGFGNFVYTTANGLPEETQRLIDYNNAWDALQKAKRATADADADYQIKKLGWTRDLERIMPQYPDSNPSPQIQNRIAEIQQKIDTPTDRQVQCRQQQAQAQSDYDQKERLYKGADLEFELRLHRDRAVRSITVLATKDPNCVQTLDEAFAREIRSDYTLGAEGYVGCFKPNVNGSTWTAPHRQLLELSNLLRPIPANLTDPRERIIMKVYGDGDIQDRRIWNWEVRMSQSPTFDELYAVILSEEGAKVFLDQRLLNLLPPNVDGSLQEENSRGFTSVQLQPPPNPKCKIIFGKSNEQTQKLAGRGEHTRSAPWFYGEKARLALMGENVEMDL
jgi:hypothetical protein